MIKIAQPKLFADMLGQCVLSIFWECCVRKLDFSLHSQVGVVVTGGGCLCVHSDCPCSFSHRSVTTVSRIVAMAQPYYMTLTLEGARRQTTGGSSSFVTVMKTSECVRRERERAAEGRKERREPLLPLPGRPWRAQAGVWRWGRERGREEGSD